MYKLLIVDDEPTVVEGMYHKLQEWEDVELDIVKVYSSCEALTYIQKNRFDIVLTDIKMPGKSGLDLMEAVVEKWPLCRVILLTGHLEFEYVYQAIQHKNVSYLLKIESYDTIKTKIAEVMREIEKDIRSSELVENATELLPLTLPWQQREFLYQLIAGAEYDTEAINQAFVDLSLCFDADNPVMVLTGRLTYRGDNHKDKKKKMLADAAFCLALEKYLGGEGRFVYAHVYRGGQLLCLLQAKDIKVAQTMAQLETVQAVGRETLDVRAVFVICKKPIPWKHLAHRHAMLQSLLNRVIRQDDEQIAVEDSGEYEQVYHLNARGQLLKLKLRKLHELEALLDLNNHTEFMSTYNNIFEQCKAIAENDCDLKREINMAFSLFFISYVNRWKLTKDLAGVIDISSMHSAETIDNLDEAYLQYTNLANYIFKQRRSEERRLWENTSIIIKAYIHNHMDGDLSLTRLASVVHYNPKYLSRMFKQMENYNLSDYIHDVRLARAKELLADKKNKIHTIGKMVGYPSPPYFTRMFKRATQISPQDYRHMVLNDEKKIAM
ncbi:MAG: response regulator [Defluviitaleaceae bacterium]|nr:response regulator [Defluviitaleaceae bacterium]